MEIDLSQGNYNTVNYQSNMKKTRLKSGLRKSKRNTAAKSLKSAGKMAVYGDTY